MMGVILDFWSFLQRVLACERGVVGDIEEEFSDEEREILGESEEEEDGLEPKEDEKEGEEEEEPKPDEEEEPKPDEEAEPKPGEEEEENLVPQSRVDEIVTERESLKTKLELLRTNPAEYYKRYPEDAPGGEQEQEEEGQVSTELLSFSEAADQRIKGGKYHGMTLREVHEKDPMAAYDIYNDYRDEVKEAQAKEKAKEDDEVREAENQVNAFANALAQNQFGKPLHDIPPEDVKKIESVIDDTIKWMGEKNYASISVEDAYFLQHKDDILSSAQSRGQESLIKFLSKDTSTSIRSNQGGDTKTGYEQYLNLSPEQLAAKIDNMDDARFSKFLKNAPPEMKKKFPGVEWDAE